jgi:hypothetical protein
MKGASILAIVTVLAFASLALTSCDNRSQLEKDIDKAATDVEGAAKDAQKSLGL